MRLTWAPPAAGERPTTYVLEAGTGEGKNDIGTFVAAGIGHLDGSPGAAGQLLRPALRPQRLRHQPGVERTRRHDAVAARPRPARRCPPVPPRARRRCRGGRRWPCPPRRWCWPLTPASLAEGVYARGVYPIAPGLADRRRRTSCRSRSSMSLRRRWSSALIAVVVVEPARLASAGVWRAVAAAVARTLLIVVAAAVAWFQLAWGLNYARPPVDVRLALPPAPAECRRGRGAAGARRRRRQSRPRGRARRGLSRAARRAGRAGRGAARGRARGWPAAADRARRGPSRRCSAPYFRMAGVDGLTAPAAARDAAQPRPHRTRAAVRRSRTSGRTWPAMRPRPTPTSWPGGSRSAPASPAATAAGCSCWRGRAAGAARACGARRWPALAAGPREDLAAIERRAAAQVEVVQRRRLARVRWLPAVAGRGRGAAPAIRASSS